MAVPVPRQTVNMVDSTAVASTTHQITTGVALTSQGGAVCPSSLSFAISYDNGAGGIGTSVISSSGATWTRRINRPDATNGETLEVWEATNVPGGATETITWTGSAAVKAILGVAELDQVAPVSPIDGTSSPFDKSTSRVDTSNSSSRTSASTNSVKQVGMLEVYIGWIGWNDSRTITAAGATWTGLVTLKGSGNNLGLGFERKAAEVKNISGGSAIARFTMSASGTQPANVACLTYFRDGVQTSTDEDGMIDNIEGVETIATTFFPDFVYMSSASAPNGGTGGSEKCNALSFFPQFKALISGVTVAANKTLFYNVSDGFDNMDNFGFRCYTYNNGGLGNTLNSGDTNPSSNFFSGYSNSFAVSTADMTTAGEHSVALTNSDWNASGTTNVGFAAEGDNGGSGTNTYSNLNEYQSNVPQYIVLQLNYPTLAAPAMPRRMTLGAGL